MFLVLEEKLSEDCYSVSFAGELATDLGVGFHPVDEDDINSYMVSEMSVADIRRAVQKGYIVHGYSDTELVLYGKNGVQNLVEIKVTEQQLFGQETQYLSYAVVQGYQRYLHSDTDNPGKASIEELHSDVAYWRIVCLVNSEKLEQLGITVLSIPPFVTEVISDSNDSVKTLILPDSVQSLTLRNGKNGTYTALETVVLSSAFTQIAKHTFYECNKLRQVEGIEQIREFGERCFEACFKLQPFSFSKELIAVHQRAFLKAGLEGPLTIPESCVYIGAEAFYGTHITSLTLHCSCDIEYGYEPDIDKDVEGDERYRMLGGMIRFCGMIGDNAFVGCRMLQTVKAFHASCISSTNSLFEDCEELHTVELIEDKHITYLGEGMFKGCSSLVNVTLPARGTYIGIECFVQTNIRKLHVPGECYVGSQAFAGTALEEIIFSGEYAKKAPVGYTASMDGMFGAFAFDGCDSLRVVQLPKNIRKIGERCFRNCSGLETLDIPDSVVFIGQSCFEGCTALRQLKIPRGCTKLVDAFLHVHLPDLTLQIYSECRDLQTELDTLVRYDCIKGYEWI